MSESHRQYLFALEQFGIKLGLEQTRALLAAMQQPERAFASIVIAGTNGKGSVTAMVERGLRAAGVRTGRYTSPHLVNLEERFVIDGVQVMPAALDAAAGRMREAARTLPFPPSFFEATTAMALNLFRSAGVEVAVLEVGLGGRLDATNAVDAVAAAITAIDLDHEQYLGTTTEAIAREKAGVIKDGAVVVLGANPPAVRDIVAATCAAREASLVFAPAGVVADVEVIDGRTWIGLRTSQEDYGRVPLSLRGRHQVDNAITAVRVLESVNEHGIAPVSAEAIRAALTETSWPGRLELLHWRGVDVILDGAHNPAGARALASYLDETYGRRLPLVVGAMRDKNVRGLLGELAGSASHFICTAPDTPRAAMPDDLAAVARSVAPDVEVQAAASVMPALELARQCGDTIVVAGSLYLVGEVRAQLS